MVGLHDIERADGWARLVILAQENMRLVSEGPTNKNVRLAQYM